MTTPEVQGEDRAPSTPSSPQEAEHWRSLDGRIILVTGASRGLGRAVALQAAREKARVIALARTRGALEALDDEAGGAGTITLLPLDLRKHEEVDRLGPSLWHRFGRLDALIHCAGELPMLAPVAHLDPRVLERALQLDIAATHRLIRTLDPLLRAAPAGRALFMTDTEARPGRAYWGGYACVKAAQGALVAAWAAETRRLTRLRVMTIDPGPMATTLRARAYPGERPDARPAPAIIAPEVLAVLGHCPEEGGHIDLRKGPADEGGG